MKIFMPELTEKERFMALQENASKIEQTTYQKPLTLEEITARREDFTNNSIALNRLEDEFKEVKDRFTIKTNPLKESNKKILEEIKTQQTTVDGTLFHLMNHEEGMMETYDQEGYLISSRRLRPEEKQIPVFNLKTANR